MFNKAYTHWSPFTIPPTPTIPSGSTDSYALSCEAGANGSKNPSQFLKWKKLEGGGGGGLPDGAMAKEFDICENGEVKKYWLIVWDEEPNLEEPAAE